MACLLSPDVATRPSVRLSRSWADLAWVTAVRISVLVVVFAMALFSAQNPTWASSSPSAPAAPGLFPVNPGPHGYFEYTLPPGGATSGTIVVHDLTTSPARYLIYVTGATTSPVGGIAYGQPELRPQGTAAWVRLSAGSVQVSANSAVTIHFTVTVPGATRPGDYVAAMVAQTPTPTVAAPSQSTNTGVRLLTTTRVIVAMVVHVPGPVAPAARIGLPNLGLQQHRRQVLTIPIDDSGNMLMKPYLAGNLRNCSGGPPVLRLARQLDTFVPHTKIDYPWYLNNQILPAGCYRATLTLGVGAGGTRLANYVGSLQVGVPATKVQPLPGQRGLPPGRAHWLVWVAAVAAAVARFIQGLPMWVIAVTAVVVLLLIGVLILTRVRRRRRRRRYPTPPRDKYTGLPEV